MKKRLLCMGLAAVFAVSALAFAGCGGEGEKAELEKQLSAVQATVQTQKEELATIDGDFDESGFLIVLYPNIYRSKNM